ncbi:MAG: hypothetical protein LBK67_06500 [Coriobacteriales bacterium]|jgi:hypothetical protein|nr:hypothetical protein [Coriobacteriales bacterium]
MLAADAVDFKKMKILLDDIAEVRINLDDEEWNQLLERFRALESGDLS